MKTPRLRGHDLRMARDCHGLIGVDEAGRGALAGPVVAGAVLLNRDFLQSNWCRRQNAVINDSKQLSAAVRERVFERMEWLMREHRILFAAGSASVAEIEQENILGATRLAMRRAIDNALALGHILSHAPDPLFNQGGEPKLEPGACVTDWKLLIDGRPMRQLGFAHRGIVNGDAKSLVIAMASIVAKVTRDRLMDALEVETPGYGFARHKGYATPRHREALIAGGSTPHHRPLFVKTFLDGAAVDNNQTLLDFSSEPSETTANPLQPANPKLRRWSRMPEDPVLPDPPASQGKNQPISKQT